MSSPPARGSCAAGKAYAPARELANIRRKGMPGDELFGGYVLGLIPQWAMQAK